MRSEALDLLNHLAQCAIDGRDDFAGAAEWVADEDLKQVFTERAAEYLRLVEELQDEVRDLGGVPQWQGSITAAAHRGWARVIGSRVMDPDLTALDELNRGEDDKRRVFDQGLRAPLLPPRARQAIEHRRRRLFGGHESVPRLRQRFHHSR